MKSETKAEIIKQCEEWMDTFSWQSFRDRKRSIFGSLPNLSALDLESLTSLFRTFVLKTKVPLTLTSDAEGDSEQAAYDKHFFEKQRDWSEPSAKEIVPILIDLVEPRRVLDVGCGVGTWLATFIENGVTDVLGIDGPWVDEAILQIPTEQFLPWDLRESIEIAERFDLAVSVEVAEHLPASSADKFVTSLCRLAPVICFSAAIPFQGGKGHVNEQWPDYWIKKFAHYDFECIDCLRRQLWANDKIESFYAQNIFLFCNEQGLEHSRKLLDIYREMKLNGHADVQAYIHPKVFMYSVFNGLFAGTLID